MIFVIWTLWVTLGTRTALAARPHSGGLGLGGPLNNDALVLQARDFLHRFSIDLELTEFHSNACFNERIGPQKPKTASHVCCEWDEGNTISTTTHCTMFADVTVYTVYCAKLLALLSSVLVLCHFRLCQDPVGCSGALISLQEACSRPFPDFHV